MHVFYGIVKIQVLVNNQSQQHAYPILLVMKFTDVVCHVQNEITFYTWTENGMDNSFIRTNYFVRRKFSTVQYLL